MHTLLPLPPAIAVTPPQRSCLSPNRTQIGFSLVELLVATVLLSITVVGSVALSQRSGLTASATNTRYRQQALVDADVARVRRLNDRYTCISGTCTSAGSTDPDRNGYFPPPVGTAPNITNSAAGDAFEALCNSTNLISQLATDIGSTPPAALSAAGITYSIDTANQGQQNVTEFGVTRTRNLHRYTITYSNSSSGELLRRVTLVPTTVAWCP